MEDDITTISPDEGIDLDGIIEQAQAEAASDFDKEKWAADKQALREQLYEMRDKATEWVAKDGGYLKRFLEMMAEMPRLSVGNLLLVDEQDPEAIHVGTYEYWAEQGVSVNKGETSHITILEPGKEYEREDGTSGQYFEPKKVFDITQTSAELPKKENHDITLLIKCLASNTPAKIALVEHMEYKVCARYDKESNVITMLRQLDGASLFKALSIEMAHAHYAQNDKYYTHEKHGNAALLASVVVCERYGVDTSAMQFDRMPALFEQYETPKEMRAMLQHVRDGAAKLTQHIEKNLEAEPNKNADKGVAEPARKSPEQVLEER
jgi:hypothetical protein